MSDGMSDANAVGRIHERLVTAAYELRDAIRAADLGYRGLTVDVVVEVNAILRHSACAVPYQLREVPLK